MLSKYAIRGLLILGAAGLSLALVGCSCYREPPIFVVPPQPPQPPEPPEPQEPPIPWRG
jgi:hypothetical protein